MGGKTWSREEEVFFWHTIVPQSPKAARQISDPLDWEQCATKMHQHFGRQARRNFTKLMLFEHYFQNVCTGHKSPRARDLVAEHMSQLELHGRSADIAATANGKSRGRRVTSTKPPSRVNIGLSSKVTGNATPAKLPEPIIKENRSSRHFSPSFDHLQPPPVIDFGSSASEAMTTSLMAPINQTPSTVCSTAPMLMGCNGQIPRESYIPPVAPMTNNVNTYHDGFSFNTHMTEATHEMPVDGYNSGRAFCSPISFDTYNDSGYGTAATSPNTTSPGECR
ncbi:hypothetical protein CDD81_1025 [Ophiocordyceps australis]|uniref:Uncharacterized protein n=1 Tax=Ophiocordyceps australis TaxID=1399860 RepID=A0A2C5Y1S8_9HYPO|nr:hypothetical protein CDD81_1025 [Ophiocordyceps australis]